MKLSLSLFMVTFIMLAGFNSRGEEDKDKAFEAFENGKQLFKSEHFKKAADSFRTANELNPNWKLYFNIGQSEAASKRYGLALEAFEMYLSKGGDEIAEERQKKVQKEIDRLQRIVGFLSVEAPNGVSILVDGINRGTAPIVRELPVATSVRHEVVASLDGEIVSRQFFQVSGGRTTSIELSIIPLPQPSGVEMVEPGVEVNLDEPIVESDEDSSPLKKWGWFCVGTGGAAIVGGSITGILALQAKEKVETNCPDGCYSDDYRLIEKRDNLALATDILVVIGGAAALTGVVLLIVDASSENHSDSNIAFVTGPGAFAIVGRF